MCEIPISHALCGESVPPARKGKGDITDYCPAVCSVLSRDPGAGFSRPVPATGFQPVVAGHRFSCLSASRLQPGFRTGHGGSLVARGGSAPIASRPCSSDLPACYRGTVGGRRFLAPWSLTSEEIRSAECSAASPGAFGVNSRQLTHVVIVTRGGRNRVDALAVVARPSGTQRGLEDAAPPSDESLG